MKRIRIPGIVDIVSSDDAAEIEAFAQDPKLDRAYADHSIPVTMERFFSACKTHFKLAENPFQPLRLDAQKAAPRRRKLSGSASTRLLRHIQRGRMNSRVSQLLCAERDRPMRAARWFNRWWAAVLAELQGDTRKAGMRRSCSIKRHAP